MQARDVMTADVVTLAPDTPIPDIVRLFRTRDISGAPVVERGEVIGIVTAIDLIARHARPHSPVYLPLLDARIPLTGQREYSEIVRHILGMTARDIMTTPVITADANLDVEEIATMMVERPASAIPVLDGGKLVGIITHNDLIAHLEAVQADE